MNSKNISRQPFVIYKKFVPGSVFIIILFFLSVFTQCKKTPAKKENQQAKPFADKRILHIDSYHTSFEWSADIKEGIENVLKDTGILYKYFAMDTKRNPSDDHIKTVTRQALDLIKEFDPDVVIASDDNASKYIVKPYYKNTELAFVFCGVNNNADAYGYPYKNATGMVEVNLTPKVLEYLRDYAKGNRIGFLSCDTFSERKSLKFLQTDFNIQFSQIYFSNDFETWKKQFKQSQDQVDALIVYSNASINDWDREKAMEWIYEYIKVPIGTVNIWMMDYALIGLTKPGQEQGEWSAQTALKILDNLKPADIPIATNKKANIILNMKMAKKLNLIFEKNILKNATLISAE